MADINLPASGKRDDIDDAEAVALVEMLFFAYRDFVADPDEILSRLGFGRAHHRVLHFIGRSPGMMVAELLDILRITKQSLSRVLKDLITQGYVFQQAGAEDRRQRLLYLTPEGNELWQQLVAPQMLRFKDALSHMGKSDPALYRLLLLNLINAENREAAENWIAQTAGKRSSREGQGG